MNKQQAIEQVATLEKELAELKAIINQPESYGRERVGKGLSFYKINSYGEVKHDAEAYVKDDDKLFSMGNYYHTKEEAEKARDRQLAYVRITDAIREQNKGWVPDWGDQKQRKHYFRYDHDDSTFRIVDNTFMQFIPNELYGTEEAIEYVIKHHADDIKLYLGVE